MPLIHAHPERLMTNRFRGYTYIEAVVALLVLAVALIPAMDALQVGTIGLRTNVVQGDAGTDRDVSDEEALRNKMESLLALNHKTGSGELAESPSGRSSAHSGLSDAGGANPRCLVYTSWYKPEANAEADRYVSSSADTRLLWVKVQIEGKDTSLETVAYIP